MLYRVTLVTLLAISLSGCSAFAGLGENCAEDADCPADGVCRANICVLRCSDSVECPDNESCDATGHCVAVIDETDGGPQPKDAGTDAGTDPLVVTLEADVAAVNAGDEVTLSWTSEPVAESCTLFVETPFAARAAVAGAPTTGADSFVAAPEQDSDYTLECTLGDELADDAVSVDVSAAGTLEASATQLNPGDTSELSWTTNGVASCELTGPAAFTYAVPLADTPSGTTTLSTPAPGTYTLTCDGAGLDTVELEVSSVVIDDVTPNALGPDPEVVTLTYTYVGPTPLGCVVRADGTQVGDESSTEAGHQVTLSATTPLSVSCSGFGGAPLTDEVTVEQLIESFTGPASPLDYGAEEDLVWTTPDDAVTCTIDGVEVESPHTVTFTQSGTIALECTRGEATTSVTYEASVRPGINSVVGTLTKEDPGLPEADVVIRALTTLNASGCVVSSSHLTDAVMDPLSTEADHKVFELVVTQDEATPRTGAVSYVVSCESDPGAEAVGDDVVVWWGNLSAGDLDEFAAAQAKLLTGNLSFSDTSNPGLAQIAGVEEIGGVLTLSNVSGLTALTGFEQLRSVHGNVSISNNAALEKIGSADEGLIGLQYVGGSLAISNNNDADHDTLNLQSLTAVGRDLTISGNAVLDEIAASALVSVGGFFILSGSAALTENQLAPEEGFDSLSAVGEEFQVTSTALVSLSSYFPSLTSVNGGGFTVTSNVQLPCTDIEAFYCGLDEPRPGTISVNNNKDSCGTLSISCPQP